MSVITPGSPTTTGFEGLGGAVTPSGSFQGASTPAATATPATPQTTPGLGGVPSSTTSTTTYPGSPVSTGFETPKSTTGANTIYPYAPVSTGFETPGGGSLTPPKSLGGTAAPPASGAPTTHAIDPANYQNWLTYLGGNAELARKYASGDISPEEQQQVLTAGPQVYGPQGNLSGAQFNTAYGQYPTSLAQSAPGFAQSQPNDSGYGQQQLMFLLNALSDYGIGGNRFGNSFSPALTGATGQNQSPLNGLGNSSTNPGGYQSGQSTSGINLSQLLPLLMALAQNKPNSGAYGNLG